MVVEYDQAWQSLRGHHAPEVDIALIGPGCWRPRLLILPPAPDILAPFQ
jgi:hypothetical protein